MGQGFPCIRLEREKFKLTNQDSADGKNILSSRQCKLTGKALKSGNFSHWRWHEIFTKGDLQFPKPYHIVKSEKYETTFLVKLNQEFSS